VVSGVLWRLGRIFASRAEVGVLAAGLKKDLAQYRADHEQKHAEITARLDRGEARFAGLETHLSHLPTARDIQDVRDTMAALRAEMAAVRETHSWIREQVQLLVRHELSEGGGS